MYLSELIVGVVNQKLQQTFTGKRVRFYEEREGKDVKVDIFCTDARLGQNDGNCWLVLTDDKNKEHEVKGQGLDIYFEVLK